jgi:DNA-binding transcriptional MerR regulator
VSTDSIGEKTWTTLTYNVHNSRMRIGELAARAAVNIQTVRFYERRGIIKEPPRSSSGYRCYAKSDLDTLCFIRQSQALGFSLREITQLLPLHSSVAKLSLRNRKSEEMRVMAEIARRRLDQVDQKLRLLKAMRAQLMTFVTRLKTRAPIKCLAPPRRRRQLCVKP